jgi:hypothetical protein
MAVLLQRAVLIASALADTLFASSKRGESMNERIGFSAVLGLALLNVCASWTLIFTPGESI